MIIILIGKSGSGKDTVRKLLQKRGVDSLVPVTTRPARLGEVDGEDYYFVGKIWFRFAVDSGLLVEHREYRTSVNGVSDVWYYGLTKSELSKVKKNKNYSIVLTPDSADKVVEYLGKENCIIAYIYLDDKVRTNRAATRPGFDQQEWDRRLVADSLDFQNVDTRSSARFIQIDNSGTLEHLEQDVDRLLNEIKE